MQHKNLPPCVAKTRPVGGLAPDTFIHADPYFLGCRFHALLRRVRDHSPLSANEKAMLPWLSALRAELRGLGVRYLEPEVRLAGANGLPGGICDLVATGGLARRGAIEVKVTDAVPDEPEAGHLLQVGGYAELLGHRSMTGAVWAALAYVSFREARVRVFAYRDARELIRRAHRLFTRNAADASRPFHVVSRKARCGVPSGEGGRARLH
ncbi:hypothetical protein OH491_03695 [Termitidicoccus mucosus]|uniref:hypothetical protein n=1 Tax=Termitidicoccus mucosus TaxID=1184151 RepID=UPI0011AB4E2D